MTGLQKLELWTRGEESELWWDSCPMSYPSWRDEFLDNFKDDRISSLRDQLDHFFDAKSENSLLRGVTTNPNLVLAEIRANPDLWTQRLTQFFNANPKANAEAGFQFLYQTVLSEGAAALKPMWDRTNGKYGWISAQVDPRLMFDRDAMVQQGIEFSHIAPNVMVKIPGTEEGYKAIEDLSALRISTNGTFSYTLSQILACARAVHVGLARARSMGIPERPWRSVVTFMISRFELQGDLLHEADTRDIQLSDHDVAAAGLAVLKRAQTLLRQCGYATKLLVSSLSAEHPKFTDRIAETHVAETTDGGLIFTCTPRYLERLATVDHETNAIQPWIDRSPTDELLERLTRLPYFRQAYYPFGIESKRFYTHSAFTATAAEALRSTRHMMDFCQRALDTVQATTGNVDLHAYAAN